MNRVVDGAASLLSSVLGLSLLAKKEIKETIRRKIEHRAERLGFVRREEFEVLRAHCLKQQQKES